MCGIAGILHADPSRPADSAALARMRAALRHRGPDDEGVHADGALGLCHVRLSVLDLSPRGHQPMRSPSGRFWLSYNGEVYNFRELRRELEATGRRFESGTDSEVILHLAEVGGLAALERLEGMFAFALWDAEERRLLLVRDRVGIKPLFYAHGPWGIAFASEPKALRQATGAAAPSAARIAEYLAFRHCAGEESLLPEVRTLAPGHRLVTDGRRLEIDRWWTPGAGAPSRAGDTGAVITAAVERQLVSDVPVGVFLSGGNDSALVTAAARDALPALSTFTVGFHEAGWDETERARVVVRALGTQAHEIRLTADEYVAGLARAIWHLDAPLNHAHSVHLLALSRFARARITVALTGEGSDELFAGYPRYRLALLARTLRPGPRAAWRRLGRALRARRPRWARLLEAAAEESAVSGALNAAFVPVDDAAQLAGLAQPEDALGRRIAWMEAAIAEGRGEIEALLELERRTYLVSLLQRMDRMSMAVGLECRVPLLDERVIEHALALPLGARIDLRDSKKPIRRAAEARFGRAFAHAPKSGFGVPLGAWLRGDGPLGKLLGGLLDDPPTRTRGWIDTERARGLLAEHRSGARDHSELLWGALNLELWARVCVDGDGAPPETR
jgi:asparagine synthase (glutamine-hydrolysing)